MADRDVTFDGFGIGGNRAVFDDLVKLLRTGEAIGFVGAGASAPLYPLWGELVQRLADRAVETRCADERTREFWLRNAGDKPDQVAQQIHRAMDGGEFSGFLRHLFGPKAQGETRYTPAHAALVRLPFQGFVTTNYDPGLDEACSALLPERKAAPFSWQHDRAKLWLREPSRDPRELPIFHAHGRYDEAGSIILTIGSYRRLYGTQPPYLDQMGHLFGRERLVFLGFSFADPWISAFADQVQTGAGTRDLTAPPHIAILGLPEEDRDDADLHEAPLRESLRARVLFYPVKKIPQDDGRTREDHSALQVLLDALLDAVATRAAAPAAAPIEANPLDAWFDHVAEEHRRLADCFDRPGRMSLIEEAWVQLEVRPDLERVSKLGDGGESWVGRKLTLEEALDLGPDDAPWITGRWLLEGPPGSGKTTMLRYRARELAEARDRSRVPLFVSLSRVIGQDRHWLAVATDGFQHVGSTEIAPALETAGTEGRLVVFLDGLDEVPPGRRPAIQPLLQHLRTKWPRCKVVLSTRPLGRGEIPTGFPRLDLLPLERERQLEFLAQWFRHAGRSDEDAASKASHALAEIHADRGLRDLAGIPLYLTLLAVLLEADGKPPDRLVGLYDRIFRMLLGGEHRSGDAVPIPAEDDVRDALRHLALGMTEDDLWAESPGRLERRLRDAEIEEVVRRLRTEPAWRRSLRRFLDDVHEQTQILGPHDGKGEDWRFWHRTFREALTAERLWQKHGGDDVEALVAWARDLPESEGEDQRGEGRWAEPLALLAGRLAEPDALVTRLAAEKPALAIRSMVFTHGLRPETLVETLGLTDDPNERSQVFEKIPEQLDDPRACLALVEQLKDGRPGGFDFFWMGWILDQVAGRWPGFTQPAANAQRRLFERLPPPDPALFQTVDTPLDGRVDLWRTIPAGEGWIGSPEEEEGRQPREGPRHRIEVAHPFALAAVPITNAQYAAFDPARANADRPSHPVAEIDWYESTAFCRWLSTAEDFAGARLPAEEEWEYACRAGTTTRYWKGDAESDLAAVGWYRDNSGGSTHSVGEKPANPWGLYDVHGNVWEWTITAWDAERYRGRSESKPFPVDPSAKPEDLAEPRARRVFRGGSFFYSALRARSAFRFWDGPGNRWQDLGFRVLLPRPPAGGRS